MNILIYCIKKVWNIISLKRMRLDYKLYKIEEKQKEMYLKMQKGQLDKTASSEWAKLQYEKVLIRKKEAEL